jgi:hypothetical protein
MMLPRFVRVVGFFHQKQSQYSYLCPPHTLWTYWFHSSTTHTVDILVSLEFYLSMDLDHDFNWTTVLIKRPNGLTSGLLMMLIILQSRSERSKFSWLQRFRWFWSSFSSNFYGIEIPRFHKIRCPNHYLRACIECIETSGFQIPTVYFSAAFLYNARPPTFSSYELISI